jgi:Carboxypeptidase regulatory-like domain
MRWQTLIGAILLFCVSSSAEPPSSIAGHVLDSEGGALANARVLLHWDPSGNKVGWSDNTGIPRDATAVTDVDGNYSISVPAGFYDVFASAMAFTPTAAKVRVQRGKVARHNVRLKIDPLVSKELD